MSIGRVPGATGIQPSIVTAKGDLIVATASGSVTNQAVGSNNQVLMADSAQADGVKWANEATATLTTTGDLLYASAANTPARLAIGSTSQVLTVSGGVPTWATPAGGGTKNFSLLNAGGTSLSGSATVTISGISNQDFLWVLVTDASTVNAVSNIKFRFNADATSKYKSFGQYGTTTVTTEAAKIDKQNGNQDDGIYVVSTSNAGSEFAGGMSVFGCATAGVKVFNLTTGISKEFSGAAFYSTQGIYTGTSTISSVSIVSSSGNFDAGTIFVYGAS